MFYGQGPSTDVPHLTAIVSTNFVDAITVNPGQASMCAVGAFEFLGAMGLAMHEAHKAGNGQDWEACIRSVVCTMYKSKGELEDVKRELIQSQQMTTTANTLTLTMLGYAQKLNEIITIVGAQGGKTSGIALKEHFNGISWADPLMALSSPRVINVLKLVQQQLVLHKNVYDALSMVQCLHGRVCFTKWLWKLDAFASAGLSPEELAAVIRGCHLLLKRGDVTEPSKLTVQNLRGRPGR